MGVAGVCVSKGRGDVARHTALLLATGDRSLRVAGGVPTKQSSISGKGYGQRLVDQTLVAVAGPPVARVSPLYARTS